MTIAAPSVAILELGSSSSDLAEGAILNVYGSVDLSTGVGLLLRFTTFGPRRSRPGRVIKIEDCGTSAVIEVEGERWRLDRCTRIVHTGPVPNLSWKVVGHIED